MTSISGPQAKCDELIQLIHDHTGLKFKWAGPERSCGTWSYSARAPRALQDLRKYKVVGEAWANCPAGGYDKSSPAIATALFVRNLSSNSVTGRRIKYDILVAWVGDGRSYHRERVQCETFSVTQRDTTHSLFVIHIRHISSHFVTRLCL